VEAPKVNLEILPVLSDSAKKRDAHFADTQTSLGSALSALGAAISLIINGADDEVEQEALTTYLCDAGKLMCDAFHKHSIAKRSFITPLLKKSIKPVVDATIPDEFLYSLKFADLVKEAKTIEKACSNIKLKVSTCQVQTGGSLSETSDAEKPRSTKPQQRQKLRRNQEVEQVQPIAGRLSLYIKKWKKLTSDKFIIRCLQGYKIPFKEIPEQTNPPGESNWSTQEVKRIKIEIDELLLKQAIVECEDCPGQFISSYFLIPKPDGSNRLIINLKKLNKFIIQNHFKMEDICSALALLSQNDYMAFIDLKDAYFLIPVHSEFRKFLRFRFNSKLYQFTCLPFGLCTSPYVYTKIMKPVMNKLRLLGIRSIIYIDDLIFINKSLKKCLKSIHDAINLLESLGFIINFKKSSLIPNQKCKYLGFIINAIDYTLNLTDKKKIQIVELCKSFEVQRYYKIREY